MSCPGVIKLVNYIKRSSLNTRLFRELCKGLDASSETLLFHTEVRWLSKGNVVKRVFELRAEIQEFIIQQNKQDLLLHFNIDEQSLKLAYLVDIFSRLNILNLSMQGKKSTVLDFVDRVNAFIMKLELRGNSGALESTTERIFVILSRFERKRLQKSQKSFQSEF